MRDTLRRGLRFDKQLAMRQHREMVDAYEQAGVTCHYLPVDEDVPYQVYARDSSFMSPYGAVRSTRLNPSDDELRQAVALFRYGVIADLVHLPLGTRGMAAKLRDKAEQTYAIPGSTRTRVGVNTIRDWIRLYRDGGFEVLAAA